MTALIAGMSIYDADLLMSMDREPLLLKPWTTDYPKRHLSLKKLYPYRV
jgi:hypothetical protein